MTARKTPQGASFKRFMRAVLKPGVIRDLDGACLNVRNLDRTRGLSQLSKIENDWLPELVRWPLPIDNVPLLFDVAMRSASGEGGGIR